MQLGKKSESSCIEVIRSVRVGYSPSFSSKLCVSLYYKSASELTVVNDLLLSKRGPIVSDPAIPLEVVAMLTCVSDVELSIVDKPHHTRQEGSVCACVSVCVCECVCVCVCE